MDINVSKELRRFNRLMGEINGTYHEASVKLGLSDSTVSVLYTLCSEGSPCALHEIVRQSGMSKQTINSSIRKLEREGHIILKPGKGRQMHIFLTETGMELAKERIFPVIEIENKVFDSMPEEESRELLRLSRKYIEMLEENAKEILQ